MAKPIKESLIFYRSFHEAIKELPDEDRLKVYDALTEFGLNHNELELQGIPKVVFTLIKPQLEANYQKWLKGCKGKAYGKMGGRPKNPINNPIPNPIKTPKEEGVRSKVIRKNIKKENLEGFSLNETSMKAVEKLYPHLNNQKIDSLVVDFKDQARNRQKPFKDLQSGFRNYLRREWIKPAGYSDTPTGRLMQLAAGPLYGDSI